MNQLPGRLQSIDVFRAVTMLLMIFVNDADGLKNIPAWIKHVGAAEDGLGFADVVFPAFLFIVGLSLPFAIRNRITKGDPVSTIALYIISRSAALLTMGFFHVNADDYSSAAALPRAVWVILTTIAFFLIWLDYPPSLAKPKRIALAGSGIILLIIMAIVYKGGDANSPHGMSPSWWGILGIIGWSYLVCALVFLFTSGRLLGLLAALAVFIIINITVHTGLLNIRLLVIGDGSSVSLVMCGIVISVLYSYLSGRGKDQHIWMILTGIGLSLIAGGLLIRPFAGGISKIHSTPAWVFICAGISVLFFEGMIWLVDRNEKKAWFNLLKPAGTSTLTCYLIPYLLYAVYSLLHFRYPAFLNEGAGGLLRSFIVALLVIQLVGLMEKRRLRLKI